MNTLTKTQVLALFLGTANAAPLQILKDLADPTKIIEGQTAWGSSSGEACTARGGCATSGQKCAKFQSIDSQGAALDATNACVDENWCGAFGRDAGSPFAVLCWTEVAEGETGTAPADIDIAANLIQLESLITKTTVNWDAETNLVVSPKFNWQDGWFVKGDVWEERDKPQDSRCFLDLQCNSDQCCGFYPDSNNRRCISKDIVNKSTTVGPVTFTPTCGSVAPEDVTPENAKDDIAKGALTEANEALDAYAANALKDAKTAAGYDTDNCDQACKDKFDADWKAETDKADEFVKTLKTLAGYDGTTDKPCDDQCKAVFEADLLAWKKEVYTACKADAESVECVQAEELKTDKEQNRGNDYYAGDDTKRTEADKAYEEKEEASKAAIAAAYLEDNKPAAGAAGGMCSETQLCGAGLCCGNMKQEGVTPEVLKENLCADATSLKYTNQFKDNFVHVCTGLNAMKIGSSVAAAVAAMYYM